MLTIGLSGRANPLAVTAPTRRPGTGGINLRAVSAQSVRDSAAAFQCSQSDAEHPTNGDETALPRFVGNFAKGLPHNQNGEATSQAYQSLIQALDAGTVAAIEAVGGDVDKFLRTQQ